MRTLPGIELAPASVRQSATFREAAEELTAHPVSTIAVLDDERHVVGLFGAEELLRGLFPGYLGELRHTAFVTEDVDVLLKRAREARDEPVAKHMREPVLVTWDTSATHAAERFLHCDFDALAVVEDERFVGMLPRAALCRAMLERE